MKLANETCLQEEELNIDLDIDFDDPRCPDEIDQSDPDAENPLECYDLTQLIGKVDLFDKINTLMIA